MDEFWSGFGWGLALGFFAVAFIATRNSAQIQFNDRVVKRVADLYIRLGRLGSPPIENGLMVPTYVEDLGAPDYD